MAFNEDQIRDKAEQAFLASKEFCDLFYDNFGKKRHALKYLYLHSENLCWNGHYISGSDGIIKFLEHLPSSNTVLVGTDTQPVNEVAVSDVTAIIVTTFGKIQFQNCA